MKKTDTKPAKKRTESKKETDNPLKIIRQETKHGIYAIVCLLFAFFFTIAAFHKGGVAGDFVYNALTALFGLGYILVPIILTLLGITFLKSERPNLATIHTISALIFFLSGLGILDLLSNTKRGGIIGHVVGFPFVSLFETFAGTIFLTAILVISLLVLFDVKPNFSALLEWIRNKFKKDSLDDSVVIVNTSPTTSESKEETPEEEEAAPEPKKEDSKKKEKIDDEEFDAVQVKANHYRPTTNYVPPPLSLLEMDRGKANVGDIKANANIIKRTLLNFGIEVEMDEVTTGPTVTRYALKPAVGVKLSRIVGLQNDMAMALAAHPIRIEAPIPGKSLVGIEIPNKTKSTVGLGTLLADEKFKNASKALTVAIGRDISGRAHFANMAKMPHALIAGTTGSGKSVSIHTIITSLLYRNSPDDLKFIFVDPKRVELTLYNKIPHLLTPVITDAKKCILALKWAAKEMDRRYDILQAESVRDIESYHNQIKNQKSKVKNEETGEDEGYDPMPYIVIIIDELADIMQSYPRELEAAIVRLAQMSRAVGIHLILSTQRPEVNVITGLIKANVPTRIALRVPTQVDSRTILDSAGAEKLLGAGDMLFADGDGQPKRLQSAFISEEEVKNVVKYLVQAFKDELPNTIELSGPVEAPNSIFSSMVDGGQDEDDELYEQARQTVIETGKASTSFLQRKLGVGYARAARLIDILEERGVVGPGNGSKPRDVLEKTMAQEQSESGEMN